jgi:hypothetical protein
MRTFASASWKRNRELVAARRSATGHPIEVLGPQVD